MRSHLNIFAILFLCFFCTPFFVSASTFVAGGIDGNYATSPDGVVWAGQTGGTFTAVSIAYGGGKFVSVGYNNGVYGGVAHYSYDGITWYLSNNFNVGGAYGTSFGKVTYGDGKFVVPCTSNNSGQQYICVSSDGITWTTTISPLVHGFVSASAYGNGQFVLLGFAVSAYNDNNVLVSPDGITWTQHQATPRMYSNPADMTYGNGVFVALYEGGATDQVITSPDGITWTARQASEPMGWSSLTYGNGLFVATSAHNFTINSTNKFMTSLDGATWTTRLAADTAMWTDITYNRNKFVAVGYDLVTLLSKINTSVDGIVWSTNIYTGSPLISIAGIDLGYAPLTMFSVVQNSPSGFLKFRQTAGTKIPGTQIDKPASDIIKTIPNDWVLKVATTTDATGNPIELDGYQWYGVVDPTDSAVGWMASKELISGTVYLPYDVSPSLQAELERKATTTPYQTKEARLPVILQAVDTYYAATTTSSSLYGGGGGYDGLNNFQKFIQGALFPKELILAIAAHESAGTLDNEICASARDGGIGIMQITSEGFKGLGSALKNYPKTGDCRTSFPTSKYYSNAPQGIYASIKDGFRTLQEKYRRKCPDAQLTVGTLVYSCQDIERVLATWGYNGKVLTGNYLKQISNSLRDLPISFSGVTYANDDQLIEKLKLANANRIEFKKFSPVEIEVVDSQGRATGFDGTPVAREEIPFSRYDREADGGVIFFPQDQYTYRVIGTGTGTYGFRVEFTENDVPRTFYATNIPVVPGEIHEYSIDWAALDRGERGVTVRIDTNGNGIIDRVVQSDGTLTEIEPPVVTTTSPSGEYLLNATTTVQFIATDTSGIATINATLNGASVANGQTVTLAKAGKNIVEVSAMDTEGNTATTTNAFSVGYAIKGFLSPFESDEKIEAHQNRTIPVKFKLRDARGKSVSKVKASLYIAKISDGVVGTDEIPYSSSEKNDKNTGNQFRYDSEEKLYIFNLSTKSMAPGMWQIKAVLDSGQVVIGRVSVK